MLILCKAISRVSQLIEVAPWTTLSRPAFKSPLPISLLIELPRHQIWSNLIASNAIEIAEDARDSIEDALDDLSRLDRNGRQIRNTLNLAESLANDNLAIRCRLQREHITKTADATLKLKKMFDEVRKTAQSDARTIWAPCSSTGEPSAQMTQRVSSWIVS